MRRSVDETPAVPLKDLGAELNKYSVGKLHVPPLIVAQGFGVRRVDSVKLTALQAAL